MKIQEYERKSMLYAPYEYDKCLFKEEWCVRDKIKHRQLLEVNELL